MRSGKEFKYSGLLLLLFLAIAVIVGLTVGCPAPAQAAQEGDGKPLAMPTTDTVVVDAARVPAQGHNLSASGVLTVNMKNFRNDKGLVRVALFGSDAGWPGEWSKHGVGYAAAKITSGSARLTFKGLPAGNYGITVYHDENNNGQIDANVLGIPTEGYGFSRVTGMILSTPKFTAVAFRFPDDGGVETIIMRY